MSVYVPNDSLFVFDVGRRANTAAGTTIAKIGNSCSQGSRTIRPSRSPIFGMTIDGDVAYTHSAQRITANTGAKARTTVIVRVTDVLRKINGKWLIVEEHV